MDRPESPRLARCCRFRRSSHPAPMRSRRSRSVRRSQAIARGISSKTNHSWFTSETFALLVAPLQGVPISANRGSADILPPTVNRRAWRRKQEVLRADFELHLGTEFLRGWHAECFHLVKERRDSCATHSCARKGRNKKISSRFVRRLCPSHQMQKIDKFLLARIARRRCCCEFSQRLETWALFRFAFSKCAKTPLHSLRASSPPWQILS